MLKEIIRQVLYIPFVNLLIFLIYILPGHNAALAIIILTIIIKFILLIPSRKAIQSQQKVKDLQPKIDVIRKEFANDKQKQSLEIMALYRREKVSMFGSCLPSLIQFPVLIALYYAFRNGLDPSRQALIYNFVPIPETINKLLFGIDLTKPDTTYILPVLAGIVQFWQTKMLMPKVNKNNQNDPSVMMQRNMTYMFPVMTVLISRSFAAALPLYWIVSSLFSVVQQWFILRKKSKTAIETTGAETTGSSVSDQERRPVRASLPVEKKPAIEFKESKETKKNVELTVRRKQ